ncbi:hypothetical protein [Nocardioides convexus]|uniref:helix-turn-helix domain-containing protein n=1 Tax=Nocardioides convexus TaxID=2712224 RepID=UPI0024182A66|nr:hypothetical protein [Nocardioides convexus]
MAARRTCCTPSRPARLPLSTRPRAGFTAEEWAAVLDGFHARGLADAAGAAGALTKTGRHLKRTVEKQTDDLAAAALDALADDEIAESVGLLRPLAAAVVASGEIPAQSPMGLDLTEVSPAPPPA